jgi:PAS domain-containing protein
VKGSAPTSEAADAAQLHLLEQLVTHVDAVLWLTTPDKREMTYVSPGLERVFGVSPLELQARPGLLLELVHPDDRAGLRESMAEQGKSPWERRYRILRGGEVRTRCCWSKIKTPCASWWRACCATKATRSFKPPTGRKRCCALPSTSARSASW